MYVIYHSSDSFAKITGVSILSLFENNKDQDDIHVLFLQSGLSNKNKEKLNEVAQKYRRTIEFMDMPNWSEIKDLRLKSCKNGWLGFGYNRLFLTEFVPQDIDRVLYLDSDTLIEGSIKEFWNINFDDCYMAGVDDCLSSKYRALVDLNECGTYCNSGVLLINLEKWRKDNIVNSFLKLLREKNGYFVFNEQSILNSLFAGKIKIVPQKYNVNSLVYLYEYDELMKLRKPKNFYYSKDEYYEARNNPVITHYTGNFYVIRRPWVENSDHPHKDAFLKYLNMTPWAKEPLQPESSVKISSAAKICKKLPRKIMIKTVGILYNNIRPIKFRKQLKKERRPNNID